MGFECTTTIVTLIEFLIAKPDNLILVMKIE
jgi:hypothetical protein